MCDGSSWCAFEGQTEGWNRLQLCHSRSRLRYGKTMSWTICASDGRLLTREVACTKIVLPQVIARGLLLCPNFLQFHVFILTKG